MKKIFSRLAIALMLGTAISITSCSKDYDNDIKSLEERKADKVEIEAKLTEQVNLIKNQITTLETEMKNYADEQDQKMLIQVRGELEDLQELLETAIDNLKEEQEAALKTAIEELDKKREEALETAVENLTGYIDGKILELGNKIDGVDDKLNLLTTRVENLEQDVIDLKDYDKYLLELIEALQDEDVEIKESIEALRKQLQDEVKALEDKIAQAKSEVLLQLENTRQTLQNGINKNAGDLEILANLVDENYDELKKEFETLYETTLPAINNKITKNSKDIKDLRKDLTTLAFTTGIAIAKNTWDINALGRDLSKVEKWIDNYDGKMRDLFRKGGFIDQMKQAFKDIDELNTKLEDLYYTQEEIDALLKPITDDIDELTEDVGDLGDDVYDPTTGLAALNTLIGNLKTTVDGLETNVDNLMARIQSITYISEYADGKATFGGSLNPEEDEIETLTPVTLTYQVYPTEAAVAIGNAFTAGTVDFSLDLVVNKVITRAISSDIITFNITAASGNTDGLLTITAQPVLAEGKDAEFLDTNTAFQVAIKLTTDKGDVRQTDFIEVWKGDLTPGGTQDDPDPDFPEVDINEIDIINGDDDEIPHYAADPDFLAITTASPWFEGDIEDTEVIILPLNGASRFASSDAFRQMAIDNAVALGLDPADFIIEPDGIHVFEHQQWNDTFVAISNTNTESLVFDEDFVLQVDGSGTTALNEGWYAIVPINIYYKGNLWETRFVVCRFER